MHAQNNFNLESAGFIGLIVAIHEPERRLHRLDGICQAFLGESRQVQLHFLMQQIHKFAFQQRYVGVAVVGCG